MTNEQLPPDLQSIVEQLDELGEHDRSVAPDSLAQHIFDRVRPSMADEVEAPASLPFPHALRHWRVAAMLAVAAGATIMITWSLSQTNQTQQGAGAALAEIDSEINDFLSITASWEEFDETLTDTTSDLSNDFWGPDEDEDLFSEDTL